MNNRILAIVVGLLIILGAGGIFLFNQRSKPQNNSTQTNVSPTTQTVTGAESTSLVDLISLGKNQQCTFSIKGDSGTTTGVIHVSTDGKTRANLQLASSNKTSSVNMIRVGDDNYIWGDDFPSGIKIKLSLSELSANTQTSQYVNPTQKVDYHCISWTVDESVFTPPSDIKFSDIGNITNPTSGQTQTGSTNPCSAIADPTTKAACESAMSQQ